MQRVISLAAWLLCIVVLTGTTVNANGAPISGIVRSVDTANRTITVEASTRGKTRQVVIDITPATKIVRFVRAADGTGMKEQNAALEDIRAGWTVTVQAHHQGNREVADTLRVVHER